MDFAEPELKHFLNLSDDSCRRFNAERPAEDVLVTIRTSPRASSAGFDPACRVLSDVNIAGPVPGDLVQVPRRVRKNIEVLNKRTPLVQPDLAVATIGNA